jgi:hypothetical protein
MHRIFYNQNLHKESRFARLAKRFMRKYDFKKLAKRMRIEPVAPEYPLGYPEYGY